MAKINQKNRLQNDQIDDVYRAIFELSPDGIAIHNSEILLQINPAGVKMLGAANANELIGKPILSFIHHQYHARVKERFIQELKGQPVPIMTEQIIRVDGNLLDVEISATPYRYQGKAASIVFIRDITERKQFEMQREHEQGEKAALINSTSDLIWSVSCDLKLITANDAFYQRVKVFTGGMLAPGDDVLRKDLFQPEQIRFWEGLYTQVLMGEPMVSESFSLPTTGAEPIWLELNLNPIIHNTEVVGVACFGRDITQRKKAELAVSKSESRLKQATQLAGLGIWDWDATTDRVAWSGDMFRIYGISPEEFTGNGSDYFSFTHADYREAQQNNVKEAFAHGVTEADLLAGKGIKINPKELCIVRPDGTECYTIGDAVCIVDEKGNPLHMLGVTQDITERKTVEKKLRESEERFRSLSQATFEGVVIHNHGMIEDANQAFANFLGYPNPDDLIHKNIVDVLPFTPESFERIKANMLAGINDPIEVNIIQPDGTLLQVETQGRAFNFKGHTLRVVAVRDITQRKYAENEQARLTAILEATPDFVATADPGQQITYLNQAGRKMVGIGEHEDITGLKIGDLNPVWATEIIKQGVVYASKHGTWSGETARLTRDGHEFPVAQTILAHRNGDGKLEYFSTICRDITESKRAEEKIRRQLEHLTALSEIDRAITSTFDLSQSLKTLLRHVTRQLGVDAADAILFDEESQTLKFLAGTGFRSKYLRNSSMTSDKGHAARVVKERQMIQVADLNKNPEDYVRSTLLADDAFISYFGVPLIAKGQIKGVLEVFHRTPLQPDDEWLDFLNALAEQAAIAVDNALLFSDLHNSKIKLEQAYDTTLDGWSRALDLRDKETEGHTRRVTELTLQLARRMGFSEEELVHIKRGGLLHDIGKMGIPDAILLKPGALTDEEWHVMRKHTTYAYEMLSPIEYLHPALDIPYCHHERWDGSGYPRGLKQDEIPLVARIFSVVDVWDALRSDRPYRKAWEKDRVVEYILSLSGKQFDPAVVYVFLEEIGLT